MKFYVAGHNDNLLKIKKKNTLYSSDDLKSAQIEFQEACMIKRYDHCYLITELLDNQIVISEYHGNEMEDVNDNLSLDYNDGVIRLFVDNLSAIQQFLTDFEKSIFVEIKKLDKSICSTTDIIRALDRGDKSTNKWLIFPEKKVAEILE